MDHTDSETRPRLYDPYSSPVGSVVTERQLSSPAPTPLRPQSFKFCSVTTSPYTGYFFYFSSPLSDSTPAQFAPPVHLLRYPLVLRRVRTCPSLVGPFRNTSSRQSGRTKIRVGFGTEIQRVGRNWTMYSLQGRPLHGALGSTSVGTSHPPGCERRVHGTTVREGDHGHLRRCRPQERGSYTLRGLFSESGSPRQTRTVSRDSSPGTRDRTRVRPPVLVPNTRKPLERGVGLSVRLGLARVPCRVVL